MIFQKTVNNRFYASPSGAPAKPDPPGIVPAGPPATGLPKLLSLTTQASSSIISVAGGGRTAAGGGGGGAAGADSQAGVGRPAGEFMHIAAVAKPHTDDILQFRIRSSNNAPAAAAAAAQDPLAQSQSAGKAGLGLRQAPSILRKRGTELATAAAGVAGANNANSGANRAGDPAGAADASPRKRARKQQLQPDSASQLLAAAAAAAAAASAGSIEALAPQAQPALTPASAASPSSAMSPAGAATMLYRQNHSQPPPADPGGGRALPAGAAAAAAFASPALPNQTLPAGSAPASVRLTRPVPTGQTAGPIRLVKEELVLADADIALGSHENVGPDSPACSPEDEQYRRMLRVLQEEPCRPQVFSRPRACLLPPEQLCPAPADRGRARLGHFLRPADVRRIPPSKRPSPIELGRSARGLTDCRRVCSLADGLDDLRASEERLAARLVAVSRRLAPSGSSPAGCAAAMALSSPDKNSAAAGPAPLLQASAQPSRVLAELLARTRAMLLDLLSAHAPAAFVAMRSAMAAASGSASSSSSSAAAAASIADDERASSVASPTFANVEVDSARNRSSRRRRRTTSISRGEVSDAS
ncbi:hypothetical protein BOX15_Mlig025536g2 [Macrostomum lignano]|uniref:Uncharacterized protein n=2 Tax=Macrostomum lignano TaxID=282301 RepID=A0A267F7P2_9PLAT|nr:hypothetical protein BOX15_Mlig025536g2 [Macrostomum lignano]